MINEKNDITINLIHSKTLNLVEEKALNNFCNENKLTLLNFTKHRSQIKGDDKTIIKLFNVKNKKFTIPKELVFVDNVIGFNNDKIAKSYIKVSQKSNNVTSKLTSVNPITLGSYYGIPTTYNNVKLTGQGQTIGIIELGGGYNTSDLNKYFSDLGLSPNRKITSVFVDGAINDTSDQNSSTEVVLDIEVAGTLAYNANIVVYFGQNTTQGFYNAIHTAIYDTVNKPSIISISWGAPESEWATSDMRSYDALFSYAVNKGINIFVAAGDNGSSDGVDRSLNVDFPGSSPNVISCGGTSVSNLSNQNSEVVWNNNNGNATGGGFSNMFSTPSYQTSIGSSLTTIKTAKNPTISNNNNSSYPYLITINGAYQNVTQTSSALKSRGVPDVCANADPNYGYNIYLYGSYMIVGGTSAVAPFWASVTALLNQINNGNSIGFINTKLYANPSVMKDITIGNNDTDAGTSGLYNATTGWDAASGLGSIQGSSLFNLLK